MVCIIYLSVMLHNASLVNQFLYVYIYIYTFGTLFEKITMELSFEPTRCTKLTEKKSVTAVQSSCLISTHLEVKYNMDMNNVHVSYITVL